MKKIFLLLTALFSAVLLNAQSEDWINRITGGRSNEDFFIQSELVFEGRFIKVVETYDTRGNGNCDDIYSIAAYKVEKIYKGDQSLTGNTVYVVMEKGVLGEEHFSYGDGDILYWVPPILTRNGINHGVCEYSPTVFFLVSSDFPENADSKYSLHRKYKFLHREGELYVCENINIIAGLNDLVFNTREDFHDYMRQFEGYTVPEAVPAGSDSPIKQRVGHSISQDELPDCAKAAADSLHHEKGGEHKKKAGTTVSTTP